jgi:hypothetical protein
VAPAPGAAPLWRHVSTARSFDWLDPRPRYLQWRIPLHYGTRELAITGGRRTVAPAATAPKPAPGSGTPWWVFLLAGIALASAGGIAWLLHRRS